MKLFALLYLTALFSLIAVGIYGLSERVDSIQRDYVKAMMEHDESAAMIRALGPMFLDDAEVEVKIRHYALMFGAPVEQALAIARCESNLEPFAKNPESSAAGIFQLTEDTFNETAMFMNLPWTYAKDVYDVDKNISIATYLLSTGQSSRWECE